MRNTVPNSNTFRYSAQLLAEYSDTALANAEELIAEAQLLYDNGHFSRSYFIAVAAIEEIGKSFIAFEAQGRNLQASAVTAKVRRSLENHSSKINAAFLASVISHGDLRNELMGIIDLMIALKYGREQSMYVDIKYPNGEVKRPKLLVREVAARDCIQLATHCHFKTSEHRSSKSPSSRTKHDDEFYGMKDRKVHELFNTEDFWWFYINRAENGAKDISEAVVLYQREFLQKGKIFRQEAISK